MDFEEEEEKKVSKGPKFPIQMYISEGYHYFRLSKYDLAIEFFNKGLEDEPTNEKCLIGRLKCYMKLAKYSEAKEDAEAALKTHPKSCDAKMLIGEADYFLGDFEKSFLTFYRGHEARKNHNGLRCGHQMCRKAIENALNPDVPLVIDDEDVQNIYKLGEEVDTDRRDKKKIDRDQYSADVDFVTDLLRENSIESVHPECEYVRDYLRERQIFWRTQNPDTSLKNRDDSEVVKKKIEDDINDDSHEEEVNDVPSAEPADETGKDSA